MVCLLMIAVKEQADDILNTIPQVIHTQREDHPQPGEVEIYHKRQTDDGRHHQHLELLMQVDRLVVDYHVTERPEPLPCEDERKEGHRLIPLKWDDVVIN